MLIYFFFKALVQIAVRIFFRRFQVDGLQKIRQSKPPLIVVGNHPNTFMDPFIVATLIKQQVGFVGNGSIFNKYTRPIFKYFKVIPIYRKKDMPNADILLSQTELNNATFKRCYEFLEEKGTILLFPEGTSEIERRLREIKTGTARIALGAEYQNNFEMGLKILPVGINYSDPTSFRSEVFVNVGEPILLSDFKKKYNAEKFDAVEELTNRIEQQLRQLTIVTTDDEEDTLANNIEILYKNQLFESLKVSAKKKKNEFILIGQILHAIRFFQEHQPLLYANVKEKMGAYLEKLQNFKITDKIVSKLQTRKLFGQLVASILIVALGFPVYFFGLLTNYLPYMLPLRIANKITSDITYKGPILMTAGIFTFLFFYGLQLWAVQHFFQNNWLTLLFMVALPITGYFALLYTEKIEDLIRFWKTYRLFRQDPQAIKNLLNQRKELFELFEVAKNEFIADPRTIKKFVSPL